MCSPTRSRWSSRAGRSAALASRPPRRRRANRTVRLNGAAHRGAPCCFPLRLPRPKTASEAESPRRVAGAVLSVHPVLSRPPDPLSLPPSRPRPCYAGMVLPCCALCSSLAPRAAASTRGAWERAKGVRDGCPPRLSMVSPGDLGVLAVQTEPPFSPLAQASMPDSSVAASKRTGKCVIIRRDALQRVRTRDH